MRINSADELRRSYCTLMKQNTGARPSPPPPLLCRIWLDLILMCSRSTSEVKVGEVLSGLRGGGGARKGACACSYEGETKRRQWRSDGGALFPQILWSSIMKTTTKTICEIASVNLALEIAFSDCCRASRAVCVISRVWFYVR